MNRFIFNDLIKWKEDPNRKALLLRGARQVGKTFIVRQLGRTFKYFLEVNFESDRDVMGFFEGNIDIDAISTNLSAYFGVPVNDGETLVFFDEIQACKGAIQSLRFFYEKRPGLHVIAAGSLLEFALEQLPSYGVGRIRSLYVYPMSFNEFLQAAGHNGLIEMKQNASPAKPLNEAFHLKLIDWFRKFLIVGGMPEAVKTFLQSGDLLKTQEALDDIVNSLEDDFAKYKARVNTSRLKDVFQSVLLQSGSRFNVSKASFSGNQVQKNEALDMLIMAGLCYKVIHSSANGLPLAAEKNPKKFKMVFLDTGILQRSLKLNLSVFLTAGNLDLVNKGNIVEQFIGNEFIKYQFLKSKPELFYWHREKRGSTAEVDYLLEDGKRIIPVEVKSGTQGKMQSLHLFMASKGTTRGIRISMENFSCYDKIEVFPVYAVENIFRHADGIPQII